MINNEFTNPQVQVEMTVISIQTAILDLASHLSSLETERYVLMEIRHIEHALWLLESVYRSMRQKSSETSSASKRFIAA